MAFSMAAFGFLACEVRERFAAGLLFENIETVGEREFFLKQFLALLREVLEPCRVFGAEGSFHFFAEAVRQRRAGTGGGDGDLQLAAADYGGVVEIAERGDIDDIAEYIAFACFTVDSAMDFRGVGCGDDQEHVVEIGGAEGALGEAEFFLFVPLQDLRCSFWGDYVNLCAGFEEAGDFAFADLTCADD